jgi:hypothetical protein
MSVVKASVCASKTNTLKTCNSLVRNSTLDETCLDDKHIYLKTNAANTNKKLAVKIINTNGNSMSSEQRVAPNKSSENQSSKNKILPSLQQKSRILRNFWLFVKPTTDIKTVNVTRQNLKNFTKNLEIFTFVCLSVLFFLNLHLPFFIEINLRFDSNHNESYLEKLLKNTFLDNNITKDLDLLRKSDALQNIALQMPSENKLSNMTNLTITFQPIDLYSTYECSRQVYYIFSSFLLALVAFVLVAKPRGNQPELVRFSTRKYSISLPDA